jgi:Tol biopolymer transport system component
MAVGRLAAPEWKKYSDPATELEVLRLTDPVFASGMTAPHLRQFSRRADSLLYWSERFSDDSPGARQAFLLDLKMGESRQLTQAAALDPNSLTLSADDRTFYYYDGPALFESLVASPKPVAIHQTPAAAKRSGITIGADGAIVFTERANGRSRLISVLRRLSRTVAETPDEIEEVQARPRRAQILYRANNQLFLINSDGTGKRPLKTEPGKIGSALWIPNGHTFIYLHVPDNPKELVTLREHYPDENADRLLARTSQFISVSSNADASVFTGASRSLANAYVLILLRAVRRELTLCEHRASDPAMVKPVFTPDSQNVLFVSDRHGMPAVYLFHVARFVEETAADPQ